MSRSSYERESRSTSYCMLCRAQPVACALPCTDGFCFRCLQSLFPFSNSISPETECDCPCCDASYSLDDVFETSFRDNLINILHNDEFISRIVPEAISALTRHGNLAFLSLVPDSSRQDSSDLDEVEVYAACEQCGSQRAAVTCIDCSQSLCPDCSRRIHTPALNRMHKLIRRDGAEICALDYTQSDSQGGEALLLPSLSSPSCLLHSAKITHICLTCGVLLCQRCVAKHVGSITPLMEQGEHDSAFLEALSKATGANRLGPHEIIDFSPALLTRAMVAAVMQRANAALVRFSVYGRLHSELKSRIQMRSSTEKAAHYPESTSQKIPGASERATTPNRQVASEQSSFSGAVALETGELQSRAAKQESSSSRVQKVCRLFETSLRSLVGALTGCGGYAYTQMQAQALLGAHAAVSCALVTADATEASSVLAMNSVQLILADLEAAPTVVFQSTARAGAVFPGAPLTVRNAVVGGIVDVEAPTGQRVPYVLVDIRVIARNPHTEDPVELALLGRPWLGRASTREELAAQGRKIDETDLIDWEAPAQRFMVLESAGHECTPEAYYAPEMIYSAVRTRRAFAWGELDDDDDDGIDSSPESDSSSSTDENDTLPVLPAPEFTPTPVAASQNFPQPPRRFVTIDDMKSQAAFGRLVWPAVSEVRPQPGATNRSRRVLRTDRKENRLGIVLPDATDEGWAWVAWLPPLPKPQIQLQKPRRRKNGDLRVVMASSQVDVESGPGALEDSVLATMTVSRAAVGRLGVHELIYADTQLPRKLQETLSHFMLAMLLSGDKRNMRCYRSAEITLGLPLFRRIVDKNGAVDLFVNDSVIQSTETLEETEYTDEESSECEPANPAVSDAVVVSRTVNC